MKLLKKWWRLLLIILAISGVIGWEEEHCQAQTDQCRATYSAQTRSDRRAFWLMPDQQASEQQAIAAACEPSGYFCRLFGAANLPTMLLVVVGIGGIWAALRTLNAIEKQADAAVISERAWLIAELVPTAIKFGERRYRPADNTTSELAESDLVDGKNFEYTLKVTNMGRTPAFIIKYTINISDGLSESKTIEFDFPNQTLGAGERWYFESLDVSKEIEGYAVDATICFFGEVFYEHVFTKGLAIREGFAYAFQRKTGKLRRMAVAEEKNDQNPN